MDNELFELCKEVYKRTGWGIRILPEEVIMGVKYPKMVQPEFLPMYQNGKVTGDEMFDNSEIESTIPLYTSDYLLEKLPLEKGNYIGLQIWSGGNWGASWQPSRGKRHTSAVDDTPLKALLKLVLALYDAGVKL